MMMTKQLPRQAAPAEQVAQPTPAVPDGWVMVPREPTEVMVLAASMAWDRSGAGLYDSFAAALRGGVQAAPGGAPAVSDALIASERARLLLLETVADLTAILNARAAPCYAGPLTDEQIDAISLCDGGVTYRQLARAIERAVLAAAVPPGTVVVPISILMRSIDLLACIGCSPEGAEADIRDAKSLQGDIKILLAAPEHTP